MIEDPSSAERERALSHLCLAQVLDLRGNRQQAVANYQQVLSAAKFRRLTQRGGVLPKEGLPSSQPGV
jgi:hypothetical protein